MFTGFTRPVDWHIGFLCWWIFSVLFIIPFSVIRMKLENAIISVLLKLHIHVLRYVILNISVYMLCFGSIKLSSFRSVNKPSTCKKRKVQRLVRCVYIDNLKSPPAARRFHLHQTDRQSPGMLRWTHSEMRNHPSEGTERPTGCLWTPG